MIDTTSDTWEEIVRCIDAELAASSRKLESIHTDRGMTMYHRGIVAALNSLKSLPNKEPEIVLQPNDYS